MEKLITGIIPLLILILPILLLLLILRRLELKSGKWNTDKPDTIKWYKLILCFPLIVFFFFIAVFAYWVYLVWDADIDNSGMGIFLVFTLFFYDILLLIAGSIIWIMRSKGKHTSPVVLILIGLLSFPAALFLFLLSFIWLLNLLPVFY